MRVLDAGMGLRENRGQRTSFVSVIPASSVSRRARRRWRVLRAAGRERFPRHLTGIPHEVDDSWNWTLPEKFTETERRDPWLR